MQKWMRQHIPVFLAFTCLGFATLTPITEAVTPSAGGLPAARSEAIASAAELAAIWDDLGRTGMSRVIVRLRGLDLADGVPGAADVTQTLSLQRASVASALSASGAQSVEEFSCLEGYVVASIGAPGLEALQSSTAVGSIGRDKVARIALASSVPLIDADLVHAAGYRGAGQVVAVLDTGIDKHHEFLVGKVVSEACYSTSMPGSQSLCPGGIAASTAPGSGKPCTLDGCEHGTIVAGIVAGDGSGLSGVGSALTGVAPDARLISIQVASNTIDLGLVQFFSDIAKGLCRVRDLQETTGLKIAAVNLSSGSFNAYSGDCDDTVLGGGSDGVALKAVRDAIERLRDAGIATIAAAGNSYLNDGLSFPACLRSVISVGCNTDGDELCEFSNVSQTLSLLAPGEDIKSSGPGDGYLSSDGTSLSVPHVTGAWAVARGSYPDASIDEITSAMQKSGPLIHDRRPGGSVVGIRRLDLDEAIDQLERSAAARRVLVPVLKLLLGN